MADRRKLITLGEAQQRYGVEATTFFRPRYVPEGVCEWCGSPIGDKRRTSCCCKECSTKFSIATSSVMCANVGSAGGYRNHIFRRDDYTCQVCGTPHRMFSEYDIPLPTTDGELDIHHVIRVADGGTDAPDNLLTVCRECHRKIHAGDHGT